MHERFKTGGPLPNSVGALADLYAEVRELRLAMQKATDDVKARETEIHGMILATLRESPDSGGAGERYRVQMVKKTFFTPKDWPSLHAWIAQHGMFELLQKRLADKAVAELFDKYQQLPPGVEQTEVDALSFSKIE